MWGTAAAAEDVLHANIRCLCSGLLQVNECCHLCLCEALESEWHNALVNVVQNVVVEEFQTLKSHTKSGWIVY